MVNRVSQDKKGKIESGNKVAPRRRGVRVAEEVKLGKFAECEPLHLPRKQIGRGWRVCGGITLLLGAVLGVVMLCLQPLIASLFGWSGEAVGEVLATMTVVEQVVMLALALLIAMCLIAGIMLILGKRVPVGIWMVLIVMLTVIGLGVSFGSFRRYEERLCYENYAGIRAEGSLAGAQCPSVENDLILLTLRNLLIYTVGLVMLCVICRASGVGRKRRTKIGSR